MLLLNMIMNHNFWSSSYLFPLTEKKASFIEIHCLSTIFNCVFLLTSKPGNSRTHQRSVHKRPSGNWNDADDWSTFRWPHTNKSSGNMTLCWLWCYVQIFKYRDGRIGNIRVSKNAIYALACINVRGKLLFLVNHPKKIWRKEMSKYISNVL